MKNIVVVGAREMGKTTLVNALLGWDILPQSYAGIRCRTTHCEKNRLAGDIWITDTPGFCLYQKTIPEETVRAVSAADTVVAVVGGDDAEPELMGRLLKGKKDVCFVIPYSTADWPGCELSLMDVLHYDACQCEECYHTDWEQIFCVDPLMALVAAIENDATAQKDSGILPLKERLLGEETL